MKFIGEVYEDTIHVITEETSGKKNLFIEGCFMQSEKKNHNGRIYPKNVLEKAVDKYVQNYVNKKKAVGELNHPARLNVDFERATHLITELKWNGNDVYGKAKVLNTPMGQILSGLLDSGVNVGVSTRGAGTTQQKNGITMVNEDFMLTAVDVVADPSGPDCYVQGLLEGVEWIYIDGKFVEQQIDAHKAILQETRSKELQETKIKLFKQFLDSVKK